MLPSRLPVPGLGTLPVNAFLLKGPEPMLVDTGLAALGNEVFSSLAPEIDVSAFLAGTHSSNIDDVDVIDETVVPHIVCHGFAGFPNEEFFDRESYKAFFRVVRQSFSDMTSDAHRG